MFIAYFYQKVTLANYSLAEFEFKVVFRYHETAFHDSRNKVFRT